MTPLLTVGPRFDQAQSSLRKHPFLLALRRWERFAKRPRRRRARRNGCFRRLSTEHLVTKADIIILRF